MSASPRQHARHVSTSKRPTPARPSRSFLTSLHATTMVANSRAVLPAEILAIILNHLPVLDLINFARTSRRMQEMVYDDTRWVAKLKAMRCWDEAEARQRVEESIRRKMDLQKVRDPIGGRTPRIAIATTDHARQKPAPLFDAALEEKLQRRDSEKAHFDAINDGFDAIDLSPPAKTPTTPSTNSRLLSVLDRVRSSRGSARQEYGKVYAALNPYYRDLLLNPSAPKIFSLLQDPLHQAQLLSQLRLFAKSDTAQGSYEYERKIESTIALFENAALQEFQQALRKNDLDGQMNRYANVLVTLNGGASVIECYIRDHKLLREKRSLGNPIDCLNDISVNLTPSYLFFQRLSLSLSEETDNIDRIFPPSVDPFLPLLTRVGEDIISEYITTLFDEAHIRSIESYLKMVSAVFEQSQSFTKSLRPTVGSSPNFNSDIHDIVGRCFEPHIHLYLQEELEFFKSKANAEVTRWEKQLSDQEASAESLFMSGVSNQKAKADFMTSFKKVLMMPVNVLPTMSNKSAVPTPIESTSESTPQSRSETPKQDLPTTTLAAKAAIMNSKLASIASLISLEVALTLVHLCRSSIQRTAAFVPLSPLARGQCEALFIALLRILSAKHVQPGFDTAVAHLSNYSARSAPSHSTSVQPLVTFLSLVNLGDLIQQMVDIFYASDLVAPQLSERDDFTNAAAKEKKRFEAMLDERVAAGLNKGIDVLIDEVDFLASTTQTPTDYNPDAAPASTPAIPDPTPTPTAQRITTLVSAHVSQLTGITDKATLDVFNGEVGQRLFGALVKHVKRQRISTLGAVRLISDANLYFECVGALKNRELMRCFGALREVVMIFLIDVARPAPGAAKNPVSGKRQSRSVNVGNARELATIIADTERYGGVFAVEEVLEFAERRADWYGIRRDVEGAMYGMGCNVM